MSATRRSPLKPAHRSRQHHLVTAGWRPGPRYCRTSGDRRSGAFRPREVIPERRMHAKGLGAPTAIFTVTHDITRVRRRRRSFSEICKQAPTMLPASRWGSPANGGQPTPSGGDHQALPHVLLRGGTGTWSATNTPVFFTAIAALPRSLTTHQNAT